MFPVHSTDAAGRCSCGRLDCGSPGKHPRTSHGLLEAASDPEQIRTWWRRWPDANIAMNCGASGRVVVDIDDKDGRPGPESWSQAKKGLGARVDDTATAVTPSGGTHVHYLADKHDVASGNDRLGCGVDVKARGGYVLLPPSMIRGVGYAWVEGHRLEQTKPIPESLATRLSSATSQTDDRGRANRPSEARIFKGERDDTLFRDACALRKRGFSDAAIEAALLKRNAEQCDPPLPESEVRAKVASSARYDLSSHAARRVWG